MITEKDAEFLENRFKETFTTKDELQKLKSELLDKMDSILKEVKAMREETVIVSRKVFDHEERVTALETSRS